MRYAIILVVCSLCGCAGYTRHGLYDAAPLPGWRVSQDRGSNWFMSLSPAHNGRGVVFATPRRGQLFVRFYFPTNGEVKFQNEELRVLAPDGTTIRLMPLSLLPSAVGLEMSIEVPSTDFLLEFPPFTVGVEQMPPLRPKFTWSDRAYRIYSVE